MATVVLEMDTTLQPWPNVSPTQTMNWPLFD